MISAAAAPDTWITASRSIPLLIRASARAAHWPAHYCTSVCQLAPSQEPASLRSPSRPRMAAPSASPTCATLGASTCASAPCITASTSLGDIFSPRFVSTCAGEHPQTPEEGEYGWLVAAGLALTFCSSASAIHSFSTPVSPSPSAAKSLRAHRFHPNPRPLASQTTTEITRTAMLL